MITNLAFRLLILIMILGWMVNHWNLTLKWVGVGGIKTLPVPWLAISRAIMLGVSNLHVFSIFGVWIHLKIKFGGRKNIFSKNLHSKFFLPSKSEKKKKIQFLKNISYKTVLFYDKFEFGMRLAFIWYTCCPYRSKIVFFQKSTFKKFLLAN